MSVKQFFSRRVQGTMYIGNDSIPVNVLQRATRAYISMILNLSEGQDVRFENIHMYFL